MVTDFKIFIGSSKESLRYANSLQKLLKQNDEFNFDIRVWHQDAFVTSEHIMESLVKMPKEYDFALFIFGADDEILFRDDRTFVSRDNVIFECGIFSSALGRDRICIVKDSKVKLPSDFSGITVSNYTSNPNDSNDCLRVVQGAHDEIIFKISKISKLNLLPQSFIEYLGLKDYDKCKVIAHCDNQNDKFKEYAEMGIRSPGETIRDILCASASVTKNSQKPMLDMLSKGDSKVDWMKYSGMSNLFVIDSPHYNQYSMWLVDNYKKYMAFGAITFADKSDNNISVKNRIHQEISVGGHEVFVSNKNQKEMKLGKELNLFDEFKDYVLVMRLPRSLPTGNVSNNNENEAIWLISGIHTKASYAGANLFMIENFSNFLNKLPNGNRNLPDYFEAILEIPETPDVIKDFNKISLSYFNPLRIKRDVGMTDNMPANAWAYLEDDTDNYTPANIPVHTVHLDPVSGCNFCCIKCIENDVRDQSCFLSLNKIVSILTDLQKIGCKNLNFYGGEPTLHPDFALILRLASSLGFRMLLVTNGSFLGDKDIADAIVDCKDDLIIRVSIDANSSDTYARIHGIQNSDEYSFENTKSNITNLLGHGVSIIISYLLYDESLNEVSDACHFWRTNNAVGFYLRPVTEEKGKNPNFDFGIPGLMKIRTLLMKDEYKDWLLTPDWFRSGVLDENVWPIRPSEKNYKKCFSAFYRFAVSPYIQQETNLTEEVHGIPMRMTDRAWVSHCTYQRYNDKFGYEYPVQLQSHTRNEHSDLLNNIDPTRDCKDIFCCRHEFNKLS